MRRAAATFAARLTFEHMVAEPTKLYGGTIGSNYQGQMETLGKHFQRE